ncbi:hypothetical protein MKX01_037356 [Papaver californicum]|nr:hypothetical protein MKX01_037356 [Papaver californicum]
MVISHDSMHKRHTIGGKKKAWRKERKVWVCGGNVEWRAFRLDTGKYLWGSEIVTRKSRILDVVYNTSNNELVRTQTLVKGAIVQVDDASLVSSTLLKFVLQLLDMIHSRISHVKSQ